MWSRLGEQMYDWHPRLHPCPDTFGRTTSLIRPSRRADEPLPRGDPEMSISPGSGKEGNSRYLSKYASQMWLKAPCQLNNIARGQGIEMCWVRYSNRPRGRGSAHPPDVVSCAGWKPDCGPWVSPLEEPAPHWSKTTGTSGSVGLGCSVWSDVRSSRTRIGKRCAFFGGGQQFRCILICLQLEHLVVVDLNKFNCYVATHNRQITWQILISLNDVYL